MQIDVLTSCYLLKPLGVSDLLEDFQPDFTSSQGSYTSQRLSQMPHAGYTFATLAGDHLDGH